MLERRFATLERKSISLTLFGWAIRIDTHISDIIRTLKALSIYWKEYPGQHVLYQQGMQVQECRSSKL